MYSFAGYTFPRGQYNHGYGKRGEGGLAAVKWTRGFIGGGET